MNVVRPEIIERGMPHKEHVRITFAKHTSLSFYAVFLNHLTSSNKVASGHVSAFWFPTVDVKPGDVVLLYSCSGTPTTLTAADGTTTHSFYWGFPKTVWHDPTIVVVLVEISAWETSFPGQRR